MEINIDYNPTPSSSYFISVVLNKNEVISFDYTYKGQRIVKQVLVEQRTMPADQEISNEWEVLMLKDGKFTGQYHMRWVDMDKRDWLNDEIWETVREAMLPIDLKDKLLNYSHLICDNYKNLEKIPEEMSEFQALLKSEMERFLELEKMGV